MLFWLWLDDLVALSKDHKVNDVTEAFMAVHELLFSSTFKYMRAFVKYHWCM